MDIQLIERYDFLLKGLFSVKEELGKKNIEFKEVNKELFAQIEQIGKEICQIENDIEESALCDFVKTKEKKLTGGIGIQDRKNISYDETLAFKWAKEHGLCLKLDDTAFKKIAETQDLEFVNIDKDWKVTFPKQIKL